VKRGPVNEYSHLLELRYDKNSFSRQEDTKTGRHDQNSKGQIDHLWGFLREPLDCKLFIISIIPLFDRLRFTFSKGKERYIVSMNVE